MEKTVVDTVRHLCADGLDEDARIFVIDSMCELAEAELWTSIDSILAEVSSDEMKDHPIVLLSFLASTVVFKSYLKRRSSLYWAIRRTLNDQFDSKFVDELLANMA